MPAILMIFMVRKATQLLVLPLLFGLLGAGGNATLCDVLSLVGIAVHHHVEHEGDGTTHAGPFCAETHEDHEHEHEQVPCPDSCGIELSEASSPALLRVPTVSEAALPPHLLEILLPTNLPAIFFEAVDLLEPPDHGASLADPTFTGCFLV